MKVMSSSVGRNMVTVAIIPVIIVCVLITSLASFMTYKLKYDDTEDLLETVSYEIMYSYKLSSQDVNYFKMIDGIVYSGDIKVSNNYEIVDTIKENSGVEVSIFYMNERIVTTILDSKGNRINGTVDPTIWNDYIQVGHMYFDDMISIDGNLYFGCYQPITTSNGTIIGMTFAGIKRSEVMSTIRELITKSIVCCLLVCVFAVFVSILLAKKSLWKTGVILRYIKEINAGDFKHEPNRRLIKHNDEYSYFMQYLCKLNNSLELLIQKDSLTTLYNRRTAMTMLEQFVSRANSIDGKTFCLAIGDIDLFKCVNDTYGHDCGDVTLRKVSQIMKDSVAGEDFVARWGGEEFLLVFEGTLDETLPKLEKILNRIRATVISYEDKEVNVTMTFGLSQYISPHKLDILITNADRLLYKGKNSGRNMIVS